MNQAINEVEKNIIANILVDNTRMAICTVQSCDFVTPQEKQVFAVMEQMYSNGEPITAPTLFKHGISMETVGNYTINADYNPKAFDFVTCCKMLKDYNVQRQVKAVTQDFMTALENSSNSNLIEDTGDFIQSLNAIVAQSPKVDREVFKRVHTDEFVTLHKVTEHLKNYDDKNAYKGSIFKYLSFYPCTLTYIGARTSIGKTAVLVNIIADILRQNEGKTEQERKKVVLINLEETAENIFCKLALNAMYQGFISNLDKEHRYEYHRDGYFTIEEIKNYIKTESSNQSGTYGVGYRKLQEWEKQGSFSLFQSHSTNIKTIAQYLTSLEPNTVVLIDYVQKIKPEKDHNTEQRDLQEISNTLQKITQQQQLITIATAQFRRGANDKRTEEQFDLSDLRACGDLEQDADVVIGIGAEKADRTAKRLYRVLKNRYGNTDSETVNRYFKTDMAFCYLCDTGTTDYQSDYPTTKQEERREKKTTIKNGFFTEQDLQNISFD